MCSVSVETRFHANTEILANFLSMSQRELQLFKLPCSALDHINRVASTSGINCASNGAKIISLDLRTAVWRSHEVERKVVLVRTSLWGWPKGGKNFCVCVQAFLHRNGAYIDHVDYMKLVWLSDITPWALKRTSRNFRTFANDFKTWKNEIYRFCSIRKWYSSLLDSNYFPRYA